MTARDQTHASAARRADRYLREHVPARLRSFVRAGGVYLACLRMVNVIRARRARAEEEAHAILRELDELRALEEWWTDEALRRVAGYAAEIDRAHRERAAGAKVIEVGAHALDFTNGGDEW